MPAAVRRCSKAGTRHVRNLIGEMLRMLSNRLSSIHFAVVFFLKKNLKKFYLWIEKFSNNRGCMKVGWIWEMHGLFMFLMGERGGSLPPGKERHLKLWEDQVWFYFGIAFVFLVFNFFQLIWFRSRFHWMSLLLCPALENSENPCSLLNTC